MAFRIRGQTPGRLGKRMNLLGAMNAEYSLSKRWLSITLALTGLFYLLLIAAALTSGNNTKWVTFAAFVVELAIFLARKQSDAHYASGESVRRPAMLQNGLGIKLPPSQFAKIMAKYGIPPEGERITPENYYDSREPVGPRRLLEITEESAFWTGQLSERMADFVNRLLFVVVGVLVIVGFIVVQAGWPAARGELVAKIMMATVTVWCTGDLLALHHKYDSLARIVQGVLGDCEAVLSQPQSGIESLVVLGEYNCALATAPVIPGFIYNRNRQRLNLAWASRNA